MTKKRDDRAFMAWAACEPVSTLMLANMPALIISPDGSRLLWANPAGASLLGTRSLESLQTEQLPDALPLRRQIAHLTRWLRSDQEQVQRLRLGHQATNSLELVRVRKIRNTAGVPGVLLQPVQNGRNASFADRSNELVHWLASENHYAALLSDAGELIASSGDFHALRASAEQLQLLLDEADDSPLPESARVKTTSGEQHLVTAFKLPSESGPIFLLLVDTHDLAITRSTQNLGGRDEAKIPVEPNPPLRSQRLVPPKADNDVLPVETPASASAIENRGPVKKVRIDPIISSNEVMRFVWRMDERFKFTFVSPEFQELVGLRGAMEGRSWQDIAGDFQLDADRRVQKVIASKDMWSGERFSWVLPKRDAIAEIDLSAMPVFDDQKNFMGYRGFGACRLVPDVILQDLEPVVQPQADDVPALLDEDSELIDTTAVPILSISEETETDASQNHRPADAKRGGLTASERAAFEEIGRSLEQPTPIAVPSGLQATPKTPASPNSTTQEPLKEPADTAAVKPAQNIGAVPTPLKVVAGSSIEDGLKSILDRLPSGVLVVREDKMLYANHALVEMSGYTSTEAFLSSASSNPLGSFSLDPLHDGSGLMSLSGLGDFAHPVSATIASIDWAGAPASLIIMAPVIDGETKTSNTSLDLAEPIAVHSRGNWSAEELLAILNTATEGVLMIDQSGNILALNHSAEALFGTDESDLLGRELYSLLAPESHKPARDYLHSLLGAGVASVLNDGREVIGKTPKGGYMPLFMTMGHVGDQLGEADQNRQAKLCVVLRDITQWKRAEDELIAARHQAEEASSAKSDFLARISHEIRTPLNAILGFSEVIMEERFGAIGNPRYRDYIRDIHTSGAHVINLVNDLLDISKIEAGQLDLTFTAVDLVEVLKECVALIQPQANDAKVIIRTSFTEGLPRIVADAKSMRQIALNLLSNSIKFTAEGGQVIVSAALENDGTLVMRVRDTGIGMTDKELETAMEPFRQIDHQQASSQSEQTRRSTVGTGLGLPLTKALVGANRASFDIESTSGEGTLIRVTFPNTRVLAE